MIHLQFQALQARIQDILPDVAEVDWFLGQYELQDEGQSFYTAPAVYVEFQPMVWETLGDGMQRGTLRFRTHLVSSSLYEDGRRITEGGLDHLLWESRMYVGLHGFAPKLSSLPSMSALEGTANDAYLFKNCTRLTTSFDHELSPLLITLTEYSAVCYDYAAVPAFQRIIADIIFTANLHPLPLEAPFH